MEGSNRRRWLISAAIVLLLHACVAVAVLTWRHVTSAPPLFVDLTPSPSASEQSNLRPVPSGPGQTSPQKSAPEQKTESASTSVPTSSGSDQAQSALPAEPNRPQISALQQGTVAKSSSETVDGADRTAISGGGISRGPESAGGTGRTAAANPAGPNVTIPNPLASNPVPSDLASKGPARNSPMASMPLDTSITVEPPVRGNGISPLSRSEVGPLASGESGLEAAPFDQRPTSIFRPAKPLGVPDVARNSLSPNGNPLVPGNNAGLPGIGWNNAPGAHVQDRARAAIARRMGYSEPVKNAIGGTISSSAIAGAMGRDNDRPYGAVYGIGRSTTTIASRGDINGLSSGVARNSVGVTTNFRPLIPRAGPAKAGAATVAGHEMPTAPVINGHDPARSISGSAVIGGPARRSGILSGSDFGLRHP